MDEHKPICNPSFNRPAHEPLSIRPFRPSPNPRGFANAAVKSGRLSCA
jgi:hypothetical protein